jgi:hypothetical protein
METAMILAMLDSRTKFWMRESILADGVHALEERVRDGSVETWAGFNIEWAVMDGQARLLFHMEAAGNA